MIKKYFGSPKNLMIAAAVLLVLGIGTYLHLQKQKQKADFRNKILDLTA